MDAKCRRVAISMPWLPAGVCRLDVYQVQSLKGHAHVYMATFGAVVLTLILTFFVTAGF